MSRYPVMVRRRDGKHFELATGTDHASARLGMVPHYYAQILDEDDDEVWSVDTLTAAELVAALESNPVLKLGDFVGLHAPHEYVFPDDGEPMPGEAFISDYAIALFDREVAAMRRADG